ncbi:hypothetical protein [Nostoc sp.]|uniref:hypothetical protein n=1 Tax=Nostoc sp. TaxID=1180 RepID=UPI002FFB0CAF
MQRGDILADLSSAGGGSTTNGHQLTFASSGDANGVFYYLGTNKGSTVWANPAGINFTVSASSTENGSVVSLTNRYNSEFYTANQANQWVSFGLNNSTLKCNYYSIKT